MLALMRQLPPEKFDIHLALISAEGGFLSDLPQYVTIHEISGLKSNIDIVENPSANLLKRLRQGEFGGLLPYVHSKLTGDMRHFTRWLLCSGSHDAWLDEEWDVAIDYPGPPGEYLSNIVAHFVKAKQRLTWLHFDLSKIAFSKPQGVYSAMDAIFAVSEQGANLFQKLMPEYAGKVRILHNISDRKDIEARGAEDSIMEYQSGRINIVTVGRISEEKGQLQAIDALRELQRRGIKARWHFVGAGGEYMEKCREAARGLDVRFYGAQKNPYPFMRQADVYVQPSLHEGDCITIDEAKVFGVPIVAMPFSGIYEKLGHTSNSIIVKDFNELPDAIIRASSMPRIASPSADTSRELLDFLNYLQ